MEPVRAIVPASPPRPAAPAGRVDLAISRSAPRVTPTPARTRFGEVLAQGAVRGAEGAARMLPGSPLMAVALRGGSGLAQQAIASGGRGPRTSAALGGGLGVVGPGGVGGLAGAPEGPGGVGAGGAGTEASTAENALLQSQEMNLYYLELQEAMNAQNRSYTALSNVLKAQHETVKTAIGNIR